MTRLLSFILIALLSLWIGFFWFGPGSLHFVVIYLAYPWLFVTFALFLWSLVKFNREGVRFKDLMPDRWTGWTAIALVTGLLILLEPLQFKIVLDEVILGVSGEFMHFNRLSGVPRQGNDYEGSYMMVDAILDKRPFFFPFLLSLVHDFTGYRYQNAFYLNIGLTAILVTLLYVVGKMFSGHRAGILSVLMAGTLPLLGIFTTSGHFEILNLVMILVVLLFSLVYLEKPDEVRLIPLVLSLVLLCQVRYENGLYLIPFGVLILLGWKKRKSIILPRTILISPLLLILAAMQFRMIQTSSHGFFQEGPNGRADTFSLSYAPENLLSAVKFFFSVGQDQPNSYLLSVMGFSSLFAFLYYAFRRSAKLSGEDIRGTVMFCFLISAVLFSLVITFFNFGLFDMYITSRLSLPLQLFLIMLIPYILRRLGRHFIVFSLAFGAICMGLTFMNFDASQIKTLGWHFSLLVFAFVGGFIWLWKKADHPRTAILAVPALYILTFTMSAGHAQRYSDKYNSNNILIWEMDFIEERKDTEKMLFVSGTPYSALLTRTNSAFIDTVQNNPQVAHAHLKNQLYSSIYVVRRFERNEKGEFSLVVEGEALDPEVFELEPVYQKPLTTSVILRFERLVKVNLPEKEETVEP